MNITTIDCEFDFNNCRKIAFLNGQVGLHETEAALFKALAKSNYNNLLTIDNLFMHPERVAVLKIMNVDTVILGSTGTYVEPFNKIMSEFKKLNYLPITALFTMGEEAFWQYKEKVNIYTLMPMHFSDSEIVIWNKNHEN